MEPVLYNASSSGRSSFDKQAIIANNLANVNTNGFKADLYHAQTMYAGVPGDNANSMTFNVQTPNGVDLSPGEIKTTGRDLDVAIDGGGWLALKDTKGREVYSRGASLKVAPNGQLMTATGKLVLGDGGPISIPPAKSIEVAPDGTVSIIPMDGDVRGVAVLDRIRMVKLDKANVVKNDEGMIQIKDGTKPPPADTNVKLLKGALEGSNVKAIDQMVEMISAGRDFDAHMKLLSTIDDNSQKLAQLLHE